MPPKAAAAARRGPLRVSSRNTIPRPAAKSTTDASPEATPPSASASASASATTITSPELAPSLTSPMFGRSAKSSPKTTSKSKSNVILPTKTPEITPLTSPETRKSPSKLTRNSAAKATGSKASLDESSGVSATAVPVTTSAATIETVSKTESQSAVLETSLKKATDTSLENSGDPVEQDETYTEASETLADIASGSESGTKATDGSTKSGARTVVKKTIRVVKKLVKKKVPKRVQKGPSNLSKEELGKVEVIYSEGENPIPEVLCATEDENPNSIEPDLMEVDNLKPEPSASVSMEVEQPNSDNSILLEAANPDSGLSASISVAVGNCNSNVTGSMQAEREDEFEAVTGEENDSMNDSVSQALVSDSVETKNKEDGGEKLVSTTENLPQVLVEAKNKEDEGEQLVSTTDNLPQAMVSDSVEAKNKEDGGEKLVSTTETRSEECGSGNVDSGGGEGEEDAKEDVENFDVGGLKGELGIGDVVLSGEMEALERRKRRKTEIFVGGLDKDAKEEDIRKVFREVGEIIEVRLMMNDNTGKNKGFAFVRYASAADAKKALAKFASVQVCGKPCGAVPVEGNDTIFLGNIDKKWKSEDVVKLLQKIGIERIDKVTVVANPSNIECNRGFAFLELETSRDAQIAYRKLQKKDVFGKHQKIKVAWAEPLSEPDEEELLKVKSVYAEYLPSSWDENKVKDYFKQYGEIENVALARNLHSSRRKDFAFINFASREAALACIEAFHRGSVNDGDSKVNVKVSLAKPIPKGKQVKIVSTPVSKEPPKEKMKAAQQVIKHHQPRAIQKSVTINHDMRVDRSSTTAELVQLLREQASRKPPQRDPVDLDYHHSSLARKRPHSVLRDDPLYSDPRGHLRTRFESSFPAASSSYSGLSQGIGMTSLPLYHRQGAGYASGSRFGIEDYPNSLQTRGGAPYPENSGVYRRY